MSTDHSYLSLEQAFDSINFQTAIKQALQETMFLNALGINPRQLRNTVETCSSCFNRFLSDGDPAGVEIYGQQLASIGMGHQGVLALVQAINQWCGKADNTLLSEIALSSRFSLPLLRGYMQAREQRILFQQEQTRIALDRARESH